MLLLKTKTILVCPLDWGLGHATRCVPLIKQFLLEGNEVIIGADKNPLAFLKQEFPQLQTITLPGYNIEYDEKGSALKLLIESAKFYSFIKKEKKIIDQIIQDHQIDLIVSDNRYGIYSNKVESILITHQLFVKTPFADSLAHKKIANLVANFNEVWIPDNAGENNLSGDLAHFKKTKQPHKFIGPLSRFEKNNDTFELEFDICAIISGPEPQRTIFEELVLKQVEQHNLKAVVVRGLPNDTAEKGNFIFNHLPTSQLQNYIQKSKLVVCRSGYSSIMDLAVLGERALLVPTPGQTEQEYLAEYHKKNNQFIVQQQYELNLIQVLQNL